MGLKNYPRRFERLRRPAEVARSQCHFGFGNDASRTRDCFSRTEGAGGTSQQGLGLDEVAELRHRDTSQRQRWRIVAQRNALQRAQRIAGGQCASGGGDQRVHRVPANRNPVTFVTLAAR
jgi:hypothetical protein